MGQYNHKGFLKQRYGCQYEWKEKQQQTHGWCDAKKGPCNKECKMSGQMARNWRRESAFLLLLALFFWEAGMSWNLFIRRLGKSWNWVVPVSSCHSKLVESTQSVIFPETVLISFVFPFCHKALGSVLCALTLWKLYALLCAKVPKSPSTTL